MTAATAPVSNRPSRADFWASFISEVRERVREVNAIAEEDLWVFSEGVDPHPWIAVHSTTSDRCGVSCAFDADSGSILGAPAVGLIAEESEWTPRSLATSLLDDLAHTDEP